MFIRVVTFLFLCIILVGCSKTTVVEPTQEPVLPTLSSQEEISMFITVQLTKEAAQILRQQLPQTAQVKELLKVVEEYHVELEPMHPTVDVESDLATYFIIFVENEEVASQISEQLLQIEITEAAYYKPPAQPAQGE